MPTLQTRAYNEALNAGLDEEQAGQYSVQEKRRFDQIVNDFRMGIAQGEVDYEDYDNYNYDQSQFKGKCKI